MRRTGPEAGGSTGSIIDRSPERSCGTHTFAGPLTYAGSLRGRDARLQRRVVGTVGAGPDRERCPRSRTGPSPRPRPGAPDPAGAHLGVHDVHARGPGAGAAPPGIGTGSSARPPRSISPKRSSWTQSASPETPTPSSRTPPEVSRSASRPRASRAMVGRPVGGAGRVVDRLSVVKSCRRTLMVTVRPERPLLAQPRGDLAGLAGQQALHQRPVGQVGVVGALDAHRLGLALGLDRPVVLGPGQARGARAPCARPSSRTSSSRLTASRSATVWIPARRSRSAVAGPTPGMTRHVHRAQQVQLGAGGTTTRPSGLSRSLATLAMNLEVPTPTEAVSPPVASRHPRPQPLGERGHASGTSGSGRSARGQVDEGLVERQRLDQRRDLAQQRPSRSRWPRGRRRSGRTGTRRAGTGAAPRGSTWPSGRRRPAPRRTRSPPRRGPRRRRRRPACHAATACRAARRRRRTRPGRGAGPRRSHASAAVPTGHAARIPRRWDRRPRTAHRPAPVPRPVHRHPVRPAAERAVGRGPMVVMNAHRSPTLVARTPEDLLAMVPVVLGFRPQESVVMLTFDARPGPSMPGSTCRRSTRTWAGWWTCWSIRYVRHGVGAVVLVVYAADSPVRRGRLGRWPVSSPRTASPWWTCCGSRAIAGTAWWVTGAEPGCAYDVVGPPVPGGGGVARPGHPRVAGRAGRSIAADPAAVRRVRARLPDRPPALGTPVATAEVEWAVVTVAAAVADGGCVGEVPRRG